jgi:hypothetical protein
MQELRAYQADIATVLRNGNFFKKKQPDGCDDDLVIVISISWFIACSLLLPLRSFSCQFLFWDY